MRKFLIVFASLMMLACVDVSAQVTVTYAMDTPTFTLAHEDTDKSQTLDSCYLSITYRFRYKATEKDDSLSHDDLMDLQLGRKYNSETLTFGIRKNSKPQCSFRPCRRIMSVLTFLSIMAIQQRLSQTVFLILPK